MEIESIDWMHDNVPIKIGDSDSQDIYYATEEASSGVTVTLHIKMPTARVAGTWTLTVNTKTNTKHVGLCYVSSPPVIRSRFGAVRGHEGSPLSVLCEVDGFPEADEVSWQRLVENDDESNKNKLVPVTNAVFKQHGKTKNGIMEWSDASKSTGFYLCTARSSLGSDNLLLEVRIKSKISQWILHSLKCLSQKLFSPRYKLTKSTPMEVGILPLNVNLVVLVVNCQP
ncbi:Basigin isoform 1 [Schistosoma japonicum]|uniref:Basigin isoform 1 n=1 Tax=Schistosoma japonicum TaxID=6182 RepID=A0A4Z2DQI7_SCHJA|nr:Basigin isoform 1 [Schistosoma japonicum]TNN18682.1 Basigin isoform 1 [Schistosoma japonicum]